MLIYKCTVIQNAIVSPQRENGYIANTQKRMTKKTLIWIVGIWLLLMVANYYYLPPFILGFEWLGLCLAFLIISTFQIVKFFQERKKISSLRFQKIIIFTSLLLLTFFHPTDSIIEKADWIILFNRRSDIVKQVKNNQLNPNVTWNGYLCHLPFKFPVISNGGNYIKIDRNEKQGSTTVTFWIFCNYFEAPSTQFIYTNDSEDIKLIEEKIENDPSENWKIDDNWFRTTGDL